LPDFYSNMYGKPILKKESSNQPKPAAPSYQRLAGLKLTGSHMHEVEINGKIVTIPSAAYVKFLEDQIKDFRQVVRNQGEELKRATRSVNTLLKEVERIKDDLRATVKKNYGN
jgi:hypothetical protein